MGTRGVNSECGVAGVRSATINSTPCVKFSTVCRS